MCLFTASPLSQKPEIFDSSSVGVVLRAANLKFHDCRGQSHLTYGALDAGALCRGFWAAASLADPQLRYEAVDFLAELGFAMGRETWYDRPEK